MRGENIRECLFFLRTPIEKIRETVDILLPVGHDHEAAESVSERAVKLIATAYDRDRLAFRGRKPSGIMASAIYLAAIMEKGVNITQFKVAEALGVTEVTLRTGVRQINDLLGINIKKFPDRRKRYVCPFCEEAFTFLTDLKTHLKMKKIKYWTLRYWMFNDDGILVNEDIPEKMRKKE